MPKDLLSHMGPYWTDAFTVMTFIAGATTRIRVNSAVIVLPYHHPVAFAKAVSTLDVLSGGRVTLTVGAGMARGEFAALGVPFHQRGRVTDEYLAVMKLLWTADDPEFHGEFVDVVDVVFEPKPVQKPHPPVWIGGSSMAALRRAARAGDGWAPAGAQGGKGPWLQSLEDLPAFMEEARRCPGFAAREANFDISMGAVQTRIGPDHKPIASAPTAEQRPGDRGPDRRPSRRRRHLDLDPEARAARPVTGGVPRRFGVGGAGGHGRLSSSLFSLAAGWASFLSVVYWPRGGVSALA